MRKGLGGFLLGAGLFLAGGCHHVAPDKMLIVTLEPPELKAGQVMEVIARPAKPVTLRWVSGTVEVMGAPVRPLIFDPKTESWRFKTMIPLMVRIPPGRYMVRAWGEDPAGGEYTGEMKVTVK